MSNKDSISSFAQGSVSKAVLKNALPAIVAMIMVLITIWQIRFFIGQTHNDYMVAAVSLATPVFLISWHLARYSVWAEPPSFPEH